MDRVILGGALLTMGLAALAAGLGLLLSVSKIRQRRRQGLIERQQAELARKWWGDDLS